MTLCVEARKIATKFEWEHFLKNCDHDCPKLCIKVLSLIQTGEKTIPRMYWRFFAPIFGTVKVGKLWILCRTVCGQRSLSCYWGVNDAWTAVLYDAMTSKLREETVWEGYYTLAANASESATGFNVWTSDQGAQLGWNSLFGWTLTHEIWGTCIAGNLPLYLSKLCWNCLEMSVFCVSKFLQNHQNLN